MLSSGDENLGGMTVNARNLDAIVAVLTQAKFSEAQALETASAALADPKKYGF